MRQIPIKIPRSFEDALGYPRGFRWVAFFWEPCGDEAMFDDGYCSADGNWEGFLKFVRHKKVAPWLEDYNLGSSEDEAAHWLLCDLESRDVFVGEKAEVRAFLACEVRKYLPEGPPAESRVMLSGGDMEHMMNMMREELRQVPAPSMAEVEEKIRRDQEAVEKMVAELG